MVVQLMKYGADPSLIDGEGCSCVHLAAQFGHTSIVAYLIAKGQVGNSYTAEQLMLGFICQEREKLRCIPAGIGSSPISSSETSLSRHCFMVSSSCLCRCHCCFVSHLLFHFSPPGGDILLLFLLFTVLFLHNRMWTWWIRTAWLLWCGRLTGHTGVYVEQLCTMVQHRFMFRLCPCWWSISCLDKLEYWHWDCAEVLWNSYTS